MAGVTDENRFLKRVLTRINETLGMDNLDPAEKLERMELILSIAFDDQEEEEEEAAEA
jgi:hypothetical protein